MRAARPPLLALLLLTGLPGLAWADLASLRPHVVVEDEVVRLGDVFADLGPEAGDMVDVGLYLLGLAGAGAGVGIALLVFVLRSLLRRAVTLHDELAEVV